MAILLGVAAFMVLGFWPAIVVFSVVRFIKWQEEKSRKKFKF